MINLLKLLTASFLSIPFLFTLLHAEPLKIGVIFPLTGKESRQGQLGRIGIEVAINELKESFSPELIYEDSQSSPKDAVTAYMRLVSSKKVDIIFTMGSPTAMALLPLANRDQIPLFAMAVASGFSKPDDLGFRIMGTAPSFGNAIWNLLESSGKNSPALIYASDDYGSSYFNYFSTSPKSSLIKAVETYEMGTTDFRPTLLKLKRSSPDSLIIGAWAQDATLVLKQAKEIGLAPELIACPGACDNPDLLTAGDEALKNTYLVASSGKSSDRIRDYLNERYQIEPTSVVLRFFDATIIAKNASEHCKPGPQRSTCLRDAIATTDKLPGASYPIRFDKNGDLVEIFQIKRVVNGKFLESID